MPATTLTVSPNAGATENRSPGPRGKTPASAAQTPSACAFCGGDLRFIYRMDEFAMVQCKTCLTAATSPQPEEWKLHDFYTGFLFQADQRNLSLYATREMKEWLQSLQFRPEARMLDVGGGGGFMASVFESFGFGRSSYIDMDPEACRFARNELGLTGILHDDVCNLATNGSLRFDFIYCRHVLEHVLDPPGMIRSMMELLAEKGVLVIIVPNGISLEYLGYPSLLRNRADQIKKGNPGWSYGKVWRTFVTVRIAHGMDPIRHLWAITGKGIASWAARQTGFNTKTGTAFLNDPVYSPYFAPRLASNWKTRLHATVVNRTLARIRGGCHLVVHIRCNHQTGVA